MSECRAALFENATACDSSTSIQTCYQLPGELLPLPGKLRQTAGIQNILNGTIVLTMRCGYLTGYLIGSTI